MIWASIVINGSCSTETRRPTTRADCGDHDSTFSLRHEARTLARVTEKAYDVVICDLKMPRVDGKRFYGALAATSPGLARRVVFVTGDVAGTDAEAFLNQTGCRWLAKPFRLGELIRTVREVLV